MSSKIKRDPNISMQHRMIIDIFHTSSWLDEKMTEFLKNYEITHPQFNILKNVYSAQPQALSVQEIRETMIFKGSDVTRLLDRLVSKDLLCRQTCELNRRKVDITISKKGIEVIDDIMKNLGSIFNSFYIDSINEKKATEVSEILRSIRNSQDE
jgi:DNA-binding MarR family transcriptional regulator